MPVPTLDPLPRPQRDTLLRDTAAPVLSPRSRIGTPRWPAGDVAASLGHYSLPVAMANGCGP